MRASLWAMAARLLTSRVLTEMTLPPVMRLSGQSPSHEAKHLAVAKRWTNSGPNSAKSTRVVLIWMPGTCVRSRVRFERRSWVRCVEVFYAEEWRAAAVECLDRSYCRSQPESAGFVDRTGG